MLEVFFAQKGDFDPWCLDIFSNCVVCVEGIADDIEVDVFGDQVLDDRDFIAVAGLCFDRHFVDFGGDGVAVVLTNDDRDGRF